MTTRRFFLITAFGAVAIAGGSWAMTRTPKQAIAPWTRAAEGFGDPRLDALAYAILAPNPHNMQPWKIELVGDNAFRLYADLNRLLPETDPPARQITIGLGCFLELFRQAAAENDYRAEMTFFPDGESETELDERPVAHVRLIADDAVGRDPLFEAALDRRTSRAPFDPERRVPADILSRLTTTTPAISTIATDAPDRLADLRTLTREAWAVEWRNAATRRESIDVMRIGKSEINAHPWGIALSGPAIEALDLAGQMKPEAFDTPGSVAYEQSLDMYDRGCATAAAFVWSVTASNTRVEQLAAGGAWMRTTQIAARAGLSVQPLSQALQEFPAMAEHYRRAHALLAPQGGVVQMLARLGFANAPALAPREPLLSKIVDA